MNTQFERTTTMMIYALEELVAEHDERNRRAIAAIGQVDAPGIMPDTCGMVWARQALKMVYEGGSK